MTIKSISYFISATLLLGLSQRALGESEPLPEPLPEPWVEACAEAQEGDPCQFELEVELIDDEAESGSSDESGAGSEGGHDADTDIDADLVEGECVAFDHGDGVVLECHQPHFCPMPYDEEGDEAIEEHAIDDGQDFDDDELDDIDDDAMIEPYYDEDCVFDDHPYGDDAGDDNGDKDGLEALLADCSSVNPSFFMTILGIAALIRRRR